MWEIHSAEVLRPAFAAHVWSGHPGQTAHWQLSTEKTGAGFGPASPIPGGTGGHKSCGSGGKGAVPLSKAFTKRHKGGYAGRTGGSGDHGHHGSVRPQR